MNNPEAITDSTPIDDSVPVGNDSRTEEELLADIMRNSDFVDTLPEEQVPELDSDDSDYEDPEESDSDVSEDEEEEIDDTEDEVSDEDAEDDSAAQDTDVYTQDDLDLEAKVVVKIDGEETEVSFGDLIKGYSTEQHLSKKGRELGEARKQVEEEYNSKLGEIENLSKASAAVLYSNEQALSKEYHELESAIEKAREEGDTYEVNELKDKREQVQKQYWNARKQREGIVEAVEKRELELAQSNFNEQLEYFNAAIPEMIPDFDDKVAMEIREFAIEEGIDPELLDTVVDPVLIKFVDDYRRLKQGVTQGTAKRKNAKVRKAPVKKAKTNTQKQQDATLAKRDRAMSPDSSNEDQMAYLRTLAERSLSNI